MLNGNQRILIQNQIENYINTYQYGNFVKCAVYFICDK